MVADGKEICQTLVWPRNRPAICKVQAAAQTAANHQSVCSISEVIVLSAGFFRRATVFAAAGLLLVSLPACRRNPAAPLELPVTSNFNQNADGWTVLGDGDLYHSPTGGNPSTTGYIFAIDRVQGDVFYFQAPGKFLGNRADAYGRHLMFDLIWLETSEGQDKEGDDIIIAGASITLVAMLPQRPGNTWTTFAIPLDTRAGWVHRQSRELATAADIQAVLGSLQQIRIRGEFRYGPEQGGLDNVVLGVLP
jgi:hypothetical protein